MLLLQLSFWDAQDTRSNSLLTLVNVGNPNYFTFYSVTIQTSNSYSKSTFICSWGRVCTTFSDSAYITVHYVLP